MKHKRIFQEYWLKHYLDKVSGLCGLCANTGTIDTTNSAFSHTGHHPGGKYPCICPNGRSILEQQS